MTGIILTFHHNWYVVPGKTTKTLKRSNVGRITHKVINNLGSPQPCFHSSVSINKFGILSVLWDYEWARNIQSVLLY